MPESLMIGRRFLVASLLLSPFAGASGQTIGASRDYPAQPIKIWLPALPGDVTDLFTRALLHELLKSLPLGFMVLDKPDLAGAIAARAVAKADPDGHSLLLGSTGTQAIAPELLAHPDYDPVQDFESVCGLCDIPLIAVGRRSLPAATLRDLIDLATNQPQRYRYGSPGVGSLSFMAAELFKQHSRANLLHVPFAGEGQVVQALLADQLDFAILPLGAVSSAIRLGQIKVFAQMGATRLQHQNTIPTIREAGVVNAEISGWLALYAPAKTPGDRLKLLSSAVIAACETPQVKKLLEGFGLSANLRSASDLDILATRQREFFAELIRLQRLKVG